jgi:hypothetical protein
LVVDKEVVELGKNGILLVQEGAVLVETVELILPLIFGIHCDINMRLVVHAHPDPEEATRRYRINQLVACLCHYFYLGRGAAIEQKPVVQNVV